MGAASRHALSPGAVSSEEARGKAAADLDYSRSDALLEAQMEAARCPAISLMEASLDDSVCGRWREEAVAWKAQAATAQAEVAQLQAEVVLRPTLRSLCISHS